MRGLKRRRAGHYVVPSKSEISKYGISGTAFMTHRQNPKTTADTDGSMFMLDRIANHVGGESAAWSGG